MAGRVWTPRARREALLDDFERGGTPAAEFARMVGIKYPTFASWVQQRRRTRAAGDERPSAVAPVRWIEALVGTGVPRALCVQLPGRARMEIGDAVAELSTPESPAIAELRRGWCLGGAGFRERMLGLLEAGGEKL